MYANGQGVTRNYKLAYMWLNLAGLNGVEQAFDVLDDLSYEMAVPDIIEAQVMSNKCLASNYQNCGY